MTREGEERKEGFCTHIGVELPDEAGEVVVLEVVRQHVAREGGGVPHDEAVPRGAPGDDPVERRLAHQVVGLGQEWRQLRALQQRLERARGLGRPGRRRHQLVPGHEGPRRRQLPQRQLLVLELGLQQQRGHRGVGRVGVAAASVGAGAGAVHGGMRRARARGRREGTRKSRRK